MDVNLTEGKITERTIPSEIYRQYPGGSALGLYLILQEMDSKVEPLSPENILVFSVSPFTGLPISGTSRVTVTLKARLQELLEIAKQVDFSLCILKLMDGIQ